MGEVGQSSPLPTHEDIDGTAIVQRVLMAARLSFKRCWRARIRTRFTRGLVGFASTRKTIGQLREGRLISRVKDVAWYVKDVGQSGSCMFG